MKWLAALLVAPSLLSAQSAVSRTLPAAADIVVHLWVPTGTVRVETWPVDSVRVTGTVGVGAEFYYGGSARARKIGVQSKNPRDGALPQADLVVTLPRTARVWIKMTRGDIAAARTEGELVIVTVGGTVSVRDARGVVAVEAVDASVTIERVEGSVRVQGGGGNVVLRDVRGTVTAATVAGSVDYVGRVPLGDARLETISGGVTVRGRLEPKATIEVQSHQGPVTLTLDPAMLPSLDLASRGGRVLNTLGSGSGGLGTIIARSFKGVVQVTPLARAPQPVDPKL